MLHCTSMEVTFTMLSELAHTEYSRNSSRLLLLTSKWLIY